MAEPRWSGEEARWLGSKVVTSNAQVASASRRRSTLDPRRCETCVRFGTSDWTAQMERARVNGGRVSSTQMSSPFDSLPRESMADDTTQSRSRTYEPDQFLSLVSPSVLLSETGCGRCRGRRSGRAKAELIRLSPLQSVPYRDLTLGWSHVAISLLPGLISDRIQLMRGQLSGHYLSLA